MIMILPSDTLDHKKRCGSHKKMIIEYYDCVMIDRLLIDKSENLCLGGSSYFQIKSLANMSGKVELLKT